MDVTVVIPCFNVSKTIKGQLNALASQQWPGDWEVILADNGSTDNWQEVIEEFANKIPNLKVVDASKVKGPAHARNVGVSSSTSDLLLFCDADDEVASGWISAMTTALSKYDFVAGRLDPSKLNEPWVLKSRACPQQESLQPYADPQYFGHAACCNLGMKRSVYDLFDGFDESMQVLEDTDFCWKAQLAGISFHFASDAVVYYRLRDNLKGIYSQARTYGEGNVMLYKKYRALGMPKRPWIAGIKGWGKMLALFVLIPYKGMGKWVWNLGWCIGRLQGSIRYRTIAF